MQLKKYLESNAIKHDTFAASLGVTQGYISQLSTGFEIASPKRAVQIERITNGLVMRWDSRPKDWREHWPELANHPKAPKLTHLNKKSKGLPLKKVQNRKSLRKGLDNEREINDA